MTNLFTRPDTFFGVCEAIGQDLGFNPIILRVALAVALLWHPVWVIEGYFAAGAIILALRLLMPNPVADSKATIKVEGDSDAGHEALAKAA